MAKTIGTRRYLGEFNPLTPQQQKLVDIYEAKTGLKYTDQSGQMRYKIRNNPNTGKYSIPLTETQKNNIKKFQKQYDEGDSARRSYIRSGKYKGFDIKKIDDPVRLKAIENYIKDFKKEKGSLPTRNEVRKHFKATTGKDSNKALDFYLKKNNINLPTGYGTTSANLVDKDVKKLLNNKNIIKTLDQGKFPTENQIKNILKSDISVAEGRAVDLANTLKGNRDIRFFKAPTKYKKLANNYLETNIGDMFKTKGTKSRLYYERGLTKLLNLPKNIAKIRGDIIGKINNIVPDLKGKIAVDELGSITASMRRGSGPYAIFGQVIDNDFNQNVKGLGIDKNKSLLERKLLTLSKDDPLRIEEQTKYNKKINEFEKKANIGTSGKKVKGLKLSFEPPSKTIKNKKVYNQYKDLFDAHYKKTGYSFEVPANKDSIVDISKKLDNPNFQNTIKDRFKNISLKGGRVGLLASLATLAGGSYALADQPDNETPVYNSEIGAIVKPGTDDVESQSGLLDWASNNPEPLVASAAIGGAGLTTAGNTMLKGLLKTLAAPAVGAANAAYEISENLKGGDNILEAVADKTAGLGLMGSSAFSGGLGSLLGGAKLARSLTPIGATMTAAGLGKDYYEFAQDEIEKMNQMSDYDRGIYNDMLMDDTNIDF